MFSFCLKFLIKLSENVGEADAGELDIYTPRQASKRVIFEDFSFDFIKDDVLLFGNHFNDANRLEEKLSKFDFGLYQRFSNVSLFASLII